MRAKERLLDLLQEGHLAAPTSFDLAEETGLTPAYVRSLLSELEREGLAYPCLPEQRKRLRVKGRPGDYLVSYGGRDPRTAREWRAR